MTEAIRPLRTYGRTKARPLKPRQAGLVEALLPHLAVPIERAGDLEALFTQPPPAAALRSEAPGSGGSEGIEGIEGPRAEGAEARLEARQISSGSSKAQRKAQRKAARNVNLEIGFGGGEHLVAQAAAYPDQRFIGAEPFLNGVGSCLRHIEERGVANVRLHHGDARELLARLPAACLERVYILFPDPWPKSRHHKRRLIQADFVAELARATRPGGDIRFATDWANYARWTLLLFGQNRRFAWTAESPADWRNPWPGHVTTRYEAKQLGDCAPVFLRFLRT
jgi:tRNA (guanine-N7-)-methyltransferase